MYYETSIVNLLTDLLYRRNGSSKFVRANKV